MLLLVLLMVAAQSCTALLNVSLDRTSCKAVGGKGRSHEARGGWHVTCFSMRSASLCRVLLLLWMRSSFDCARVGEFSRDTSAGNMVIDSVEKWLV